MNFRMLPKFANYFCLVEILLIKAFFFSLHKWHKTKSADLQGIETNFNVLFKLYMALWPSDILFGWSSVLILD